MNAASWYFNGLTRQPWGVLAALLAAYTGLIVSLWAAALGFVVGIIVAVGLIAVNHFTRDLFHAGAGTSVTAIAVVTGALAGTGGSFAVIYSHTLLSSPSHILEAIITGAIFAAVIVAIIAVFEGDILRLRGCQRLSRDQVRRVSPALQLAGQQMGLDDTPKFAILDSNVPAAWTHMRHIVITTGLLDTLTDPSELTAVIGHELHHWRRGDSVGLHFVWVCAWPVILLYNAATWVTGFRLEIKVGGKPVPGGTLIPFIAWAIAWPSWILVRFLITPVLAGQMRKQEYEADAEVAGLGYGPPLIEALTMLAPYEMGRTGWEAAVFATHPPKALRIERLQPARPDDSDVQEGDLGIVNSANMSLAALGALFVVLTIAAVISVGAYLNNRNLIHDQQNATRSAAHFVTSFFAASFYQNQYDHVIEQQGAPQYTQAMRTSADAPTSSLNRAAQGVAETGTKVASTATALSCRYNGYAPSYGARAVSISVFMRWTASYHYAGHTGGTVWTVETIPVVPVNGLWKPANIPSDPTAQGGSTSPKPPPSGFGSCQ